MQIVVDTSVIIAIVAREPEREQLVEMTIGARLGCIPLGPLGGW